jgi:TIR domain
MSGLVISYSHQDEVLMRRLLSHLKPFVDLGMLWVFSDAAISAGSAFRGEILKAIDNAQVAVLLVSADFLSSDFIREVELPRILERHRAGELQILPVLVQDVAWDWIPWLRELQIRPWNAIPLAGRKRTGREKELAKIVREILAMAGAVPVCTA